MKMEAMGMDGGGEQKERSCSQLAVECPTMGGVTCRRTSESVTWIAKDMGRILIPNILSLCSLENIWQEAMGHTTPTLKGD